MSRKMTRQVRPIVGLMLASAMFCAGGVAVVAAPAPQAHAVSMSEYQAKVSNHAKLKSQLAGVSSDLADTILQLADLNDNQIPAAVEAAESAQQAAEQAQSLAEATTQRLQAAQQDKANLEEQIKQTGSDYDDAKAAVAQLARESFHGSSTSDVLDFVTDSTTADDFVNKMQSQAAVTRSESNAATDAANELNTSMNRKDRLGAIEQKITQLKEQADQQAASAQQAASEASIKQTALQKLRDEGTAKREKLESQKSQLTTQSAKEAADIVAMKSQIDSWNNQYNNSNNAAVNPNNNQQQSRPNNNTNYNPAPAPAPAPAPTPNNNNSGGASGMNYAVPESDVTQVSSVIKAGTARITVEYTWTKDMDEAFLDLQKAMNPFAQNKEITELKITQHDANLSPVVLVGMSHQNITDMAELRRIAESYIRISSLRI